MNKENMLEGLIALFSQNSKKEISPDDLKVINSVIGQFSESPVEKSADVSVDVKVVEEVITDKAPAELPTLTEVIESTGIEVVEEEIKVETTEPVQNTANEKVEIEADTQQYISKKDFDDFKQQMLDLMSGKQTQSKVVEEPKIEVKEVKPAVGLQKGDPARHNIPKSSDNLSKYMG